MWRQRFDDPPSLFVFRLNKPSSHSLSSHIMLPSFPTGLVALGQISHNLSTVSCPKLDTLLPTKSHECQRQRINIFFDPAGYSVVNTAQNVVGYLCRRSTLRILFQLSLHSSQVFSYKPENGINFQSHQKQSQGQQFNVCFLSLEFPFDELVPSGNTPISH